MEDTDISYKWSEENKDWYYEEEISGGKGVWCKPSDYVGFKVKIGEKMYGKLEKSRTLEEDREWVKNSIEELRKKLWKKLK